MPTWQLEKKFSFEAAHFLPNHDGKCARLHGHSWKGSVILEDNELITQGPKSGMIADFADISKVIDTIVEDHLDHFCLNSTLPMVSPTSEEVAQWLYEMIKEYLPQLVAVVIEETCTSACTYSE